MVRAGRVPIVSSGPALPVTASTPAATSGSAASGPTAGRGRIGIRHPWETLKVAWVVAGTDLAVATSGTYERGLHVIDPFRGAPATYLRSVTVTGSDLALTDAYATAALAMGERGLTWLASLDGYECAVVTAEGEALRSNGLPAVAIADGGEPPPTLPGDAGHAE